jgi:N-acetyl-gamma-glutamyl-phosphate reductase
MGTHFSEVNENVKPYKLGAHRHMPEMAQTFAGLGCTAAVYFSPHLIPMTRGIAATCYVTVAAPPSASQALEMWREAYAEELFVRVLDEFPQTKATAGSNFCDVTVRVDAAAGLVVGVSAIDNLVKGASGQAVQCMNLMFDLPEETGLWQPAVYP